MPAGSALHRGKRDVAQPVDQLVADIRCKCAADPYNPVPMRVLYDGVVFQNAYQRGIQRVFREIIQRLPGDIEAVLALSGPARGALPALGKVVRTGVPMAKAMPRKLRRALDPFAIPARLRRASAGCDLFHSTYYTPPPREMPSVVHVFDMIVERHVDFYESRWVEREIERKRVAIEGATQLIAISDATARELEYFYPRTRGRITTVHLCADHLPVRPEPVAPAPPEPYALYVGDRHLYKNFSAVLEAMESPRWPGGVGLCVAGPPWRANEALRVERHALARRFHHAGRVSDAQLAGLYRGAACVVVPAIAEGFGLPILEAQQAGAPVVCSDIAVFREVAGPGALYFDPHRAEQFAERVAEASDTGVRARLIAAGKENLARFSWDRSAAQVVDVYRSITGPQEAGLARR
jgi:glycosyltransferase involved in cell wall biosynthesis